MSNRGRRRQGRSQTTPILTNALIYGMRQRCAHEVLNKQLKLRVTDADETRTAILMHIKNGNRQT